MATIPTEIEISAVELARELHHLRPSQQRRLSQILENQDQLSAFNRAIELVLQASTSFDDEAIERSFLFGLEIRQIAELRNDADFELNDHWSNVHPTISKAFVGGYRRRPFEQVIRSVRQGLDIADGDSEDNRMRSTTLSA